MRIPIVILGGDQDDWGFIPTFLDTEDPRSAKEQFDSKYVGGWNPFEGFKWDKEKELLSYTGDPPMKPVGMLLFRNEVIVLFPSAWVMIIQTTDDSWEIARMD